jgi:hypothetical protein
VGQTFDEKLTPAALVDLMSSEARAAPELAVTDNLVVLINDSKVITGSNLAIAIFNTIAWAKRSVTVSTYNYSGNTNEE